MFIPNKLPRDAGIPGNKVLEALSYSLQEPGGKLYVHHFTDEETEGCRG